MITNDPSKQEVMRTSSETSLRIIGIAVHVIIWILVFFIPMMVVFRISPDVPLTDYLRFVSNQLICPLVFYLNYLILAPRYLYNGKYGKYILFSLININIGAVFMTIWANMLSPTFGMMSGAYDMMHRGQLAANFTTLFWATFSCAMLRIVQQWSQIHTIRKEAELQNLHNQLNPHFLLNTLNNIYALIAFDPDKAQNAVQEVSRLLRHVLYDNKEEFTPLTKEMEFISSYIELMKIRISPSVDVEFLNEISPNTERTVAPLLFISLIENAFKHGVSASSPSFVWIHFYEGDRNQLVCEIRNSNHPKSIQDKSGSGIGLNQVQKRLDLVYPGRYQWIKGPTKDGTEYRSLLIIESNN